MSSNKNYNDYLFPILYNEETIDGFFDTIFNFLYLNTDYFKVRGVDSNECGLASGEAEEILKNVFYKYIQEAQNHRNKGQSCVIQNTSSAQWIVREIPGPQGIPDNRQIYAIENHRPPENTWASHPVPQENTQNNPRLKCKTKKRVRNPHKWKANIKKAKRVKGEAYISSSGKLVEEKSMKEPCQCPKKCYEKITKEERQIIHDKFYALSKEGQNQFIANSIEETQTKSSKKCSEGDAQVPGKYFVRYFFEVNKTRVRVCQKMFRSTLSITYAKLHIICKKKRSSDISVLMDGRGRHKSHPKITEDVKNDIRAHIKSFPIHESCREGMPKYFLGRGLSIQKMHGFYVDICTLHGKTPAKLHFYRKIFREEFNYAFHPPKVTLKENRKA